MKGVRMFRKDIKIGEGDKYDLTKVSTQSVNQEEVAKKNAKLIEIFKKFDITKDGKLDSSEMAMAMDYFNSLDESGNDKISKKEFKEAAEAFNEELQLTGKDKIKAKDLKSFVKNLFSATQNDPTAETQKVLEQYMKEQQNIELEEKQRLIDDDAKRRGWELAFGNERECAYYDKKTDKYYLPNKEGTAFIEVHWSDSEKRFKVMSAEELAQLNAALEAQRAEEEAARQAAEEAKNKTYDYVVQSGDKFTEVVTKALQAQGVENPTEEQIAEAKEQFKKDNPNAIRTTSNGYEFLNVGEQVKLRGEVKYAQNSQEAIAQWAKDNPDEVWKTEEQKQAEAERKELEELAGGSTLLEEVVAVADMPTEEQKVRGKKAKEMELDTSNINGFYKKMGADGHYEYYQWDKEKQDFVNLKEKGIISVTEPNEWTTQYVLRKSAENNGYNDVVYSADNKIVKILKYDKDGNTIGRVEYNDSTEIEYNANGEQLGIRTKNQEGNVISYQRVAKYTAANGMEFDANNNSISPEGYILLKNGNIQKAISEKQLETYNNHGKSHKWSEAKDLDIQYTFYPSGRVKSLLITKTGTDGKITRGSINYKDVEPGKDGKVPHYTDIGGLAIIGIDTDRPHLLT